MAPTSAPSIPLASEPPTSPLSDEAAAAASVQLRELAFGAACAAAVRAALQLGLADALGDEPATADELAVAVGAEPRAVRRLLTALACRSVFAVDERGRFAHTPASRLLRADSQRSMRDVSLWLTEPWTWTVWPQLAEAVRTGENVFTDLYGKDFFDWLHNDARGSAQVFDRAMSRSSAQSAQDVADVLDVSDARVVADIGGGQGRLLAELLERNPGLHGVLLDLPAVVADPDPRLRDSGSLHDRAELMAGDCRLQVPVDADVYILKNILEWDDDSTRRTLRNVVAAARPGARVVVIENLVDERLSMRFVTAMDLLLLLNVGGHKHTRDSLVDLMSQAGLVPSADRPVNAALHLFDATVLG